MKGIKTLPVFLKAIHIQGFKSFADKLKLEFKSGMSVVVGPNGSGKSNIADAVRWVLGEQSAKSLRGTRMEDIIFSGSSGRRPVGMAEVSLIFDNSTGIFPLEYEEVTVTRRVYRDGEGQFYINRSPCRLKDIQELFLDTGSGKEGFSIIGQGRVEEILNLKSDERRILLEEVAGISKFRLRKKETLKKLEETEQNLSRIEDIINELEDRLEPLAEQAETARRSKELNQELNNSEIKLIVADLSDNKKKLAKTRSGMDELNNQLTIEKTAISEKENDNMKLKFELQELERDIQHYQAGVYQTETGINEKTHELKLMAERQSYLSKEKQRLEKEIEGEQEKTKNLSEKINKLKEREQVLKDNLSRAKGNLNRYEQCLDEIRRDSRSALIEELKNEVFEEMAKKTRFDNELRELENKRNIYLRQQEQLTEDSEEKKKEKLLLAKEIEKQETQLTLYLDKEEKFSAQSLETDQKIKESLAYLKETEDNNIKLQREYDRVNARIQVLKALEENMEGYHRGVKECIFAYRRGDISCENFYGTVAENIEAEKNYELAVETALGNALQNIILESAEDGKKCIAYLKSSNKGKATFLPLDSVKGSRYHLNEQTTKKKGFLGLAVDLISFEEKYRSVMEYLLGRIIIVDNMDTAVSIARETNFRVRVVTLQGDQVNQGGSLTGGSTLNQNSGILGRAREIEDLHRKLQEIQEKEAAVKAGHAQYQMELERQKEQKEKLAMELKTVSEAKGILSVEKKHSQEKLGHLQEGIDYALLQLDEIARDLKEIKEQAAIAETERDQCQQLISELENKQRHAEQTIEEKNKKAETVSEQITSSKIETAKWEQELNQTREITADEQERLQQSHELIEAKMEEIRRLELDRTQLSAASKKIDLDLGEMRVQLDEKSRYLIELRQKRETFSANLLTLEEETKLLRKTVQDLEHQTHQNELRIARWEAEWDAGLKELKEEYNLSWEEAACYETEEKKEDLRKRIEILKQEIIDLGPVNYTALEEYPETAERFVFLTSQRDDLVRAGDSLKELITKLDQSMIEKFAVGFKSVNKAFQEVFKELFNGGYAELRLDDPDNLLETGVSIIAQPPGKKAQHLSLLSGGERSLTAITLLFAFLKVKPSPFCLLDEIEAALDETNVKRFVQYVKTLCSSTQFILISHRRGTMEAADILYGITMEESGVSKLLTVEFDEYDDTSIA